MGQQELRFGLAATDGGPGSSYWKLKTAATKPDVYLMGTSPDFVHTSLHYEGKWMTKAVQQMRGQPARVQHARPSPRAPGLTRAVEIVVTNDWGSHGRRVTDRAVRWVHPPDDDALISFDIFLQEPGGDFGQWLARFPAKRAQVIARVPLAHGGIALVVATAVPFSERTLVSEPMTDEMADGYLLRMKATAESASDPRLLIIGGNDDGAIALWHARIGAVTVGGSNA